MNANTALKINDAVSQAVLCGETPEDILGQVYRAAQQALKEKHAREERRFSEAISSGRETWKANDAALMA